jgi:hypothetical protein
LVDEVQMCRPVHRRQRTEVSGRTVARLVAADACAVLSRPEPEESRLMAQHMSLGIKGVEAQGNVYGKLHDHGTAGIHRHRSDGALLSRTHPRKNP